MRLKWIWILTPLLALASLVGAGAQLAPDHSMSGQMNMPMNGGQVTMEMPGMAPATGDFLQTILQHTTSGTSAEPNSTPAPMLMRMSGKWMLMFHGNVFLVEQQQTSPRGGDKFFSTNWFMPMAQRELGPGELTLRAMLSLEPATVTGRQYPLLFQQGETAYGNPIVDGQHPHDFFMELAALYDWHVAEKTLLSLYLAPVGDPALGADGLSASGFGVGRPAGGAGASPGRLDAYFGRCDYGGAGEWNLSVGGERISWAGAG